MSSLHPSITILLPNNANDQDSYKFPSDWAEAAGKPIIISCFYFVFALYTCIMIWNVSLLFLNHFIATMFGSSFHRLLYFALHTLPSSNITFIYWLHTLNYIWSIITLPGLFTYCWALSLRAIWLAIYWHKKLFAHSEDLFSNIIIPLRLY